MGLFTAAQAPHFRNTNFFNTGLAKFQHVFATVVTSIRGQFLTFMPARVNLIVNDDSGTVLHQLQRATKLHRLVQFPLRMGHTSES